MYFIVLGDYYYNNNNYHNAISYHNKAIDNYKFFNLGSDYYALGDYEKSLENYMKLEDFKEKDKFYYNIGNIYFRMGEQSNDKYGKINLFQKSVDNYNLSLKVKDNVLTKYNYLYVLNKLQKLENEIQKDNEDGETEYGEEDKNNKTETNSGEVEKEDSLKDEYEDDLTEEQEEDINNYIQGLKQDEKYNQKFFNKNKSNYNSDIIDSYFSENFSSGSVINNLEAKDW